MADSNSTRRHHNFKDLTGKQFGKWTVIAETVNHPSSKYVYWTCLCECGTTKSIRGTMLTGHRSQSCSPCSKRNHGMEGTPEYSSWHAMKQRCKNPNATTFPNYGGNDITICERWESFENFYADMGPKPSKSHTIDRYPNQNGNYEPNNCRWATPEEQARNRRSNRLVSFNGKTMCVASWSSETGINVKCLHMRLQAGWSVERALTEPVQKRSKTTP